MATADGECPSRLASEVSPAYTEGQSTLQDVVFGDAIREKLEKHGVYLKLSPDMNVAAFAVDCLNRVCNRYGGQLELKIERAHAHENVDLVDFMSSMDASKDTDHNIPGPTIYMHAAYGLDARTLPHLAQTGTKLLAAPGSSRRRRLPSLVKQIEKWVSIQTDILPHYVGAVMGAGKTINDRLADHSAGPFKSGAPLFGTVAHFAHAHGDQSGVSIASRTLFDADDIGAMCLQHGISEDQCLSLVEPISMLIFQTLESHGRGGLNVNSMMGSGFGHGHVGPHTAETKKAISVGQKLSWAVHLFLFQFGQLD
jgi:hypothetical protein